MKEILCHRYRVGHAETVEQFAARSGGSILFSEETVLTTSPVRYVGEDEDSSFPLILPSATLNVCLIHNAAIIGSSNLFISQTGELLYDLLIKTGSNKNYRLSDRVLKKHHAKPWKLANRFVVHYLNLGMNMDAAISLVCNFSTNYYHFIYEVIAKFYLLSKCQIPQEIPLVVDNRVREVPQLMELLRLFAGNRRIEYLKPRCKCQVKNLYCISAVNQIIPNYFDINLVKTEDNLFCLEAILYIRQHFLGYARDEKTYPKRFYIARKNTTNRSYNEQELTRVASKYGFEIVSPEIYSVAEQFALFASAECIIGASGAALSNIVCCKPGCRVLVLFSHDINLTVFSGIAGCLDVDMRYLIGECEDPLSLQTSYTIDAERFRNSITDWLLKE